MNGLFILFFSCQLAVIYWFKKASYPLYFQFLFCSFQFAEHILCPLHTAHGKLIF